MGAQPQHEQEPESGLSDRDARILDFERRWWTHAGAKEEAIRSEFALSAARYYQLLNAVIDTPEAVRHDPMLVRRLLRARDARTSARAARAFRIPASDEESND
ncbi:DUF3263 domain-containing protein [Antiquaquibacter soli]|uniref:DUF3263 domain-containing protein n=1 Tax=Antiquaquibacter soli TaxID=3064523 RepID=A0ABT9BVS1_9MICO|nr:DUF3263 domain-containing protein [Protaetiibacter sp. WY-16]MDO7883407.1 DUF3263 domain-containing protein [Protaetiibacter sp. WY-16]